MLQPNLADHPVSDFQQWPPWRPLVVATATELARFTGQHLIAPQTILARAYLEQIFAGLRGAGLLVFHAVLDADDKYCASASSAHLKHRPGGWPIWPGTGRRARG
jgi:hypothetical protein